MNEEKNTHTKYNQTSVFDAWDSTYARAYTRRPTQCNRMSTTMTMTTSMTNIVKHSDVLKMCVMRSPCLRHHISNKVQIVLRACDRRHLQYSVFVPLMTFITFIQASPFFFSTFFVRIFLTFCDVLVHFWGIKKNRSAHDQCDRVCAHPNSIIAFDILS